MKPSFAALALVIAFGGYVVAQDENTPSRKAGPDDYKRLATARNYTGKMSVGPKSIIFRIDDGEYQKKLKWAQERPNPVQQKTAIAQVEAAYRNLKWALGKEFELELHENVKLRKMNLPFEYDDKGNAKIYTAAERAKLKGSSSLPGYTAKIEDFGGDANCIATFGPLKNGKPVVTMVVVTNNK